MEDKWKDIHKLPFSNWRETAMDEGLLFMEVIQQQLVQNDNVTRIGLISAAKLILAMLPIIQGFEDNEETLEKLAADGLGLVVAIWRSHDKADYKNWPSHSIKEVINELTGTLQLLYSVVIRKAQKNRIKRAIFSMIDIGDMKYCRRRLASTAAKLEAEPGININSLLLEVVYEQEYLHGSTIRLGKKRVTNHDANANKREAERMLEVERKKCAEEEWRNFTVLMHAR